MEIGMPKFSNEMDCGTVTEWFVKPGDTVKEGDILCSVETEKLTFELKAPANGVIDEILVGEGEEANVGQPVLKLR